MSESDLERSVVGGEAVSPSALLATGNCLSSALFCRILWIAGGHHDCDGVTV